MYVFPVTARRLIYMAVLGTMIAVSGGMKASAQASREALRAYQTELFDVMNRDPQNLDVMFEYAGVSARIEDYEAAISTLERMLIFNDDLPRVRLELGVLYFRIGSYAVAERYFASVMQIDDLPPTVGARVATFRKEIERRSRRHQFTGRVELGAVYDSNASLGPENRDVLLGGFAARLTDESLGESDVGARFVAELTHRYDFGSQNDEFWQTDAAIYGRRYADVDRGSTEAFFLRTGPQLAVDDRYFGMKLRPFIDATHVRADDSELYTEGGLGIEFREVLGDEWSTFGAMRGAIREHRANRSDEDGAIIELRSGVAWTPVRDLALTATIGAVLDKADVDNESNVEGSIRLTASYDYDPGLAVAEKKWHLSSYVSVARRHYDEPDPVVTLERTRRDTDLRAGVQHVFNFRDGFYASLGASMVRRESNISNFDLENVGVSAALGYSF